MQRENSENLEENEAGSNACTVGFIARKDGRQSHDVVAKALFAKAETFHRVGYAADGKTTDGDGIETQVPQSFFQKKFNALDGAKLGGRHIAVGQVWLPRDQDMREKAQHIINRELAKAGYKDCKWREEGLTDIRYMGEIGQKKLPYFAQILIPLDLESVEDPQASERELAFLREHIKTELRNANLVGNDPDTCHFSSFSGQRIIYAARSDPKDEGRFFPDLRDKSFVTAYAKIHGRFTTAGDTRIANIQPTAQGIAHNGTIVTDRGAAAAMKTHQIRIANQLGEKGASFLPLMWPSSSDSVNFGRVNEALGFTGLSMPARKMLLLAKAEGDGVDDSEDVKNTKRFLDAAMEKYDGPALIIMSDGRHILATLDANGLRPAMIEETAQYFALGSEFGMWGFNPDTEVVLTDELDRGSMLMMDTATGVRLNDHELQEQVAREYDFKDWAAHIKDFDFPEPREPFKRRYEGAEYAKRLRLAGYSKEDLTKMLMPMVASKGEPNSSMGNLTRAAAFSDRFSPWSQYYNELHVQIVAPPHNAELDPDVMNLHGYSRYPLDEEGNPRDIVRFPNKFIFSRTTLGQFTDMIGKDKFAKIDCTFNVHDGEDAYHKARKRIGAEAVEAAKLGKHIILSDENIGPNRAPIFMSHAVGEANVRLTDEGLRGDVSIIVKDAYTHTSHEVKILKETGANFVVPYLALEHVIDMADRGVIKNSEDETVHLTREQAVNNFLAALEKGTLISMQRTGTMRASSSQGAHQFEVFGINRELTQQVHPNVASPISGIDEREIQRRIVEHHRQTYFPTVHERLAIISEVDGHVQLNPGGRFGRNDTDGEIHAQDSTSVDFLHRAKEAEDFEEGYRLYKQYSDYVHSKGSHYKIFTRDHYAFKYARTPLPLKQVEGIEYLSKRKVTGAMQKINRC